MSFEVSKESVLRDLADFQKGYAFKSVDYQTDGIKIVRVSNLSVDSIDEHSCVCIDSSKAKDLERYNLLEDDIIITTVGSWASNPASVVGKVVRVPNSLKNSLLNQNAVRVRAKDGVNQDYLYYVLKRDNFRDYLIGTAQGSANQASITQNDIKTFKVNVNNSYEQILIGEMLRALDDKIELNNRMNKVLEQMAQAIFKQWFVDFEFPNENGSPYKSSGGEMVICEELGKKIPREWKVGKIIDIAEILMGQSPKSEFYNSTGEGMPFHQGVANYGYRFPVHIVYCTQSLRIAKKGSLLISVRAPVGRLNIADSDIIIGRGLGALNSKDNCNSFLFSLLQFTFAIEHQHGSGTIYNSVSKKELEDVKVTIPDSYIMLAYDSLAYDINHKIFNLSREIKILTELRDTLLPKLMSGEIDVS